MHNMNKKILATAFAAILAAMVLVPMAQASHYTWYFSGAPEAHASMGTFEASPDTSPTNIPSAFAGLTDRLVTTHGLGGTTATAVAGADGAMVFDLHFSEGPAPSGNVPFNYYLGENVDPSLDDGRLSLHGSFWAWHGYWRDVNSDGVIDEEYNTALGYASGTDEFIWRGIGSDEPTDMVAYLFPSDRTVGFLGGYDGDFLGVGPQNEPRGFAGNCNAYPSEPNCWEPTPDINMADRTNNDAGQGNQQWLAESGWNDQFAEEWLITGLHTFGVVGGNSVSSPEAYDVDCSDSGETCAYDYDNYEALAGQGVSDLYLTTMNIGRDTVWQNQAPFNNGVTDPVTGGYTVDRLRQEGVPVPDVCPWQPVEVCEHNTAHLDGEQDDTLSSSDLVLAGVNLASGTPFVTNVGGTFEQHWCDFATGNNPQCDALTGHGVYGGFTDSPVETRDDVSSHEEGLFIAANVFAWRWTDNGDGFIGEPTATEQAAYHAGLDNNINDGFCTQGDSCELTGHAGIFQGKIVRVGPAGGSWPPGTFVSRVYDRWSDGEPFTPGSDHAWFEQSIGIFGTNEVDLRTDGQGCSGNTIGCRTVDAIFVPGGSHGTLAGITASVGTGDAFSTWTNGASATFTPGTALTWTEGSTDYTKTYASLTDFAEAGALGLI